MLCRGLYEFENPSRGHVAGLLTKRKRLHAARDTSTGNILVWYWRGPVHGDEHIVPDDFGLPGDIEYLGQIRSIEDFDKLTK